MPRATPVAARTTVGSDRETGPGVHAGNARRQKRLLSNYRGQAVMLNFWATWCGPCKIEMPWFVELQKEYGPQGLQILGVAMDDSSKEDIQKFAKDMGVNYTILDWQGSRGQAYGGVDVLPTTFFIDRDGNIVTREFGLQSRSLFRGQHQRKRWASDARYRRKSNVSRGAIRSTIRRWQSKRS